MKFVLFSLCCLLSNASISQDDLVKRVDQMLKAASMNNVPPQNNNIDADLLKISSLFPPKYYIQIIHIC